MWAPAAAFGLCGIGLASLTIVRRLQARSGSQLAISTADVGFVSVELEAELARSGLW